MQSQLGEGHATNRPPLFNGSHYRYWKIRMQVFLESQSLDVWSIIEEGYHDPIITEQDSEGHVIAIKLSPRKIGLKERKIGQI